MGRWEWRWSKKTVWGLVLGQFVSLLITSTGFSSSQLSRRGINAPTSQSFFNYLLLAIFYGAILVHRRRRLQMKWFYYVMLAVVDVEANYLVVKAYQYTSFTSVMLLDCCTIPCVIFLTWIFLKTEYGYRKFAGVAICVAGLVLVVFSDVHSSDRAGGPNPLKGDLLVVAGSMLYAVSNVSEEFIVKEGSRVELMAMLGLFGALISACQISILERTELKSVHWTVGAVLPFVGFALAMFLFYSTVPVILKVYRHGSLMPSQICYFSTKGKKKSKSNASDSGDDNLSKKDLALQQALDQITASFGKGAIMWLGRSHSPREVPVISTGSFSLDLALGIGGLPKGRVVEIYGQEASGKTTLALHVIAEAQKTGGYCAFVDAEHALDPALAKAIGVKTDNLLLSQPDSGEQALSLVDTLIRSGSIDVVVVDSVAALVPKSELDGEMGDAHMALQARLMSQALRKLSHSLSLSQTILIFINQVRCKLSTFGGFGGPTEVTSGGYALKFYASVRLNIKRIGLVKKGEETVGSQILVKIVKNKHAPPFRTAQFELEFGKGICLASELIELGLKHKFIAKSGGAFYRLNGQSFHGKDAMKLYLSGNEEARRELMEKLREVLTEADAGRKLATESAALTPDEAEHEEIVVYDASDTTDEEAVAAIEV